MNYNASWSDKAESLLAKSIMHLPVDLVLKLMGRKPIVIDGQTLHPEMQMFLAFREIKKIPGMSDLPPVESRRRLTRDAIVHGLKIPNVYSHEFQIPVDQDHFVQARHYFLETHERPGPILVFYHGGGFVLGSLDMYDHVCRFIVNETQIPVLSVDYRLAPEHPYPQGLQDCLAAFKWVAENASNLNIDPMQIAVGGDSAGANFATILCQVLRDSGGLVPAFQLLIYPTADRSKPYRSEELFGEGYFLTCKDLKYFQDHYSAKSGDDPMISPIKSPSLSELPPSLIVTAAFDPLRDEGEAYAHALNEAQTPSELIRAKGMIHGFINLIGVSPAARETFSNILRTFKSSFLK